MSKVRDKRVQGMLDALDPEGAAGKMVIAMDALIKPERLRQGLSGLISGDTKNEFKLS